MLYRIIVTLHSGLRWVLLALLLVVIVRAVLGWRGGKALVKKDRVLASICVGIADLQLVIGLLLYFGLTSWFTTLLEDPGRVMGTSALRFFAVEHAPGMIVALVILHVASIRSKRADDDRVAWRRLALGFIAALVLILVSIPWPFMPYGRALFRFG